MGPASLVYSLHPSHVSSVAWASGLQELCAALFAVCSLHAILSIRDGGRGFVAAAVFYILALLSKEAIARRDPGAAADDFAAKWIGREI